MYAYDLVKARAFRYVFSNNNYALKRKPVNHTSSSSPLVHPYQKTCLQKKNQYLHLAPVLEQCVQPSPPGCIYLTWSNQKHPNKNGIEIGIENMRDRKMWWVEMNPKSLMKMKSRTGKLLRY